MKSITKIKNFVEQQHFASSSLKQSGDIGASWIESTVENLNWASAELQIQEEIIRQKDVYIARLEKINDSLLGIRTAPQELA